MFINKKVCSLALIFASFSAGAQSYDVAKRYRILEDRVKTQEMLRKPGHDFYIDITGVLNKNLFDVIDEASDVGEKGNSDAEKLDLAKEFLNKYENTEQTANAKFELGIPLFSFNTGAIEWKPNLRLSYNLGANIGIRKGVLDANTIFDLFSDELPPQIADAIRARIHTLGQGDDIIAEVCDDPGFQYSSLPQCTDLRGKYIYPDPTVPNAFALAKQDIKAGFYNDYKVGRHFFGQFNVYGLHRTDMYVRVTEEDISSDRDIIDLGDTKNSELHAMIDYSIGYTNKDLSIMVGVEELKLTTLQDRKEGSKEQTYGTSALYRVHADYLYKLTHFSLKPFVGVHKRDGYELDEGVYAGADMGFHLWSDRLGLIVRGMVDKEHYTLSPQVKLWLMHVEYMLKVPVKSEVDNVKVSALHGVNFRLFF